MTSQRTTSNLFIALCVATASARATDIHIDFDKKAINQPISAPALFDSASPLTNLYAPLGVHFAGPAAEQGGAILNDSTFTMDALSGHNFLAFSAVAGEFVAPETITFDVPMSFVSIHASGLFHPFTFTMQAFDQGGVLLDTSTITTGIFGTLSVVSCSKIKKVVLTVPNAGLNSFVFDDLFASTATASPTVSYGSGCPGTGGMVPSLVGSECAAGGCPFTLQIANGVPGATAILFGGLSPANVPVGGGCSYLLSPILPPLLGLPLDAAGGFQWTAQIPTNAPIGSVVLQSFVVDPGAPLGFSATGGLLLTIE